MDTQTLMEAIGQEVSRQRQQREEQRREIVTDLIKLLSYVKHSQHCAVWYRMNCSCGLDKEKEKWQKRLFT